MRYLRILAVLGMCFGLASFANAQRVFVGVGVGPAYVGPAPVCAYGYYGYYPYACAPYGYYGPDYFAGGVFIGAGPWFHDYYERPRFYGRPGYYGRPGFYEHRFEGREYGFHERREFDREGFRGRGHGGFRGDRGREFQGGEFHGRGSDGRGFHGGHGGRR
jgi:hypothetical protein